MTEIDERPIGRHRAERVVGSSESMRATLEQATSAARSQLPVLISGPGGSGKGHIARAIHAWSARSDGILVALSAVGVDEGLHGRELLGAAESSEPLLSGSHEGALARAAGGTLLIRRLDKLSGSARQALIQTLKNEVYQPEGQAASTPLNARVVATTQTNAVALFGEIPAQEVKIAALSERPEDVLPLAAHFLALFAEEEGVRPVGFTGDARRCLLEESWPGNVRELRERIRQAVQLAQDGAISIEALLLAGESEDIPSFKEAKRAFETRYVESLLRRCSGNISRAARLAKKDRKDFYDVIRRTGLNPSKFRS